MTRHVWLVVALAFASRTAAADKYDDAFAKITKVYDEYKAAADKLADARTKYAQYYAPLRPQWDVAAKAHKAADDECAKNKRTRACRDLTLAYAAEQKKYNAMVWDKDNADPKKEFDDNAIKVLEATKDRKAKDYDTLYGPTKKMLEDAAFKSNKRNEKARQLDSKLGALEQKRRDKQAANTSVAADAKNPPPSNTSTSTSTSTGSGIGDNGAMDTARSTAGALGHQ